MDSADAQRRGDGDVSTRMEQDELKALLLQFGAIAERLTQRNAQAAQQVEQAGAGLDRRASQLTGSADALARSVIRAVEQQAGEAVQRGIANVLQHCNRELQATAHAADATGENLRDLHRQLQGERRTWVWLGSAALIVGALLSVAASAYTVITSRKQAEQYRLQGDFVRAVNNSDVIVCGDRLCANVDAAAPSVGNRKQYRPVDPRE